MERVLVSRQPIFTADMSIYGYELLFRNSEINSATFDAGDRATAEVIVHTFMEVGLDAMVGPHFAFINFERTLLLGDYCETLPADRVILEILETVDPDDTDVVQRLKILSEKGYRIALDDFVCSPRHYPLLEIADVVKLDILQYSPQDLESAVKSLAGFPVSVLAEKVETPEQFEFSKGIGFDYFQGYFFCRPQLMRSTRMPLNRLATLQLISKLNNPNLTLRDLEESIGHDISLAYKLLRYVNSVASGVRRPVASIKHAAILVGFEKLKIWASLVLFSGLGDKPRDLIITGIVRARMCEELAQIAGLDNRDRFFLTGMFSVLDAMLDRPLDEVLGSLPLVPEIVSALTRFEGPLGGVLKCVLAYERQDWPNVKYGTLDPKTVRKAYARALAWSLDTVKGLAV